MNSSDVFSVGFYFCVHFPDLLVSVDGEVHAGVTAKDIVLAIIGERDTYTPPADVVALEAAGVDVVRYPEAEHGFAHAPDRPAHRPDDAADAFQRAHTWLSGSM